MQFFTKDNIVTISSQELADVLLISVNLNLYRIIKKKLFEYIIKLLSIHKTYLYIILIGKIYIKFFE